MKKQDMAIEIRPGKIVRTQITLVGDSPLIVNAWSEKAKRMMLESQMKTAKTKKAREPKNPFEEFFDSMYWISGKPDDKTPDSLDQAIANGAKFGFPVTAIKQAAIAASYRSGSTKDMVSLRGVFFINGTDSSDLATIENGYPEIREDMVRVGMGTADLRYRAEFHDWKMKVILTYNDNGVYTLENIINAINLGGFMCGIGEWRPERDGQYGMYHVELSEEG